MTTNTKKQSNDLRFSTVKIVGSKKIVVKIRLNDECKNGHQDFAITADIYEKKGNGQYYHSCGGCCHDEILKYFPKFKIFVDLHLSDYSGAPMYATENGYYWFTQDRKTALEYLRITDEEYDNIQGYIAQKNNGLIETQFNKVYFGEALQHFGIVDRWRKEAKEAISQLELLTETKFINDSRRSSL
ncbi:hypothetical protein M2132_001038 [Dysgonomonas sp. PH5-45]|uniref:hypothetical protein n=1 Tax=unclassified Dysgonomonas TaxID=2630389 RepID=UPI00247350B2|nr:MULTISPECIES: hypothetical protein [unclassified Dysgonomonas]MDH6354709.1 hypothetical protein [Dysgonomonas sp. PH5-45]MDH6387607.1 hypothetical protein [Dysgonomonas sp. PH5-37]